jgi:hypothetical protein
MSASAASSDDGFLPHILSNQPREFHESMISLYFVQSLGVVAAPQSRPNAWPEARPLVVRAVDSVKLDTGLGCPNKDQPRRGENAMSLGAQMRLSDYVVLNGGVAAGFEQGGVGARAGVTVVW